MTDNHQGTSKEYTSRRRKITPEECLEERMNYKQRNV